MKKLTIFLSIMLFGLIVLAQTDTTIVFADTTITKFNQYLLFESDWRSDTFNFNITKDSIFATSKWRQKDSIYVNPNRYRIIEIQKRENSQGVRHRRMRRIGYEKETNTKRIVR